jgi:hypothetical protein
MTSMDSADHHVRAEALRQLRLQLAATEDEQKRHVLLRRIEALEEEAKEQPGK